MNENLPLDVPSISRTPLTPLLTDTPGRRAADVQIDMAVVVDGQLLVYGWIFGLATRCVAAAVHYCDQVHDVLGGAAKIPRPDVTQHFAVTGGDDQHGFYFAVQMVHPSDAVESLRMALTFKSGETSDSVWPVSHGMLQLVTFFSRNPATLTWLLTHLRPETAEPLRDLIAPSMPSLFSLEPRVAGWPFQFEVDLCCLLEDRVVLILGWFLDPKASVDSAEVKIGRTAQDFFAVRVPMLRPDIQPPGIAPAAGRHAPPPVGFTLLSVVSDADAPGHQVEFNFRAGPTAVRVRRPICRDPAAARTELGVLLGKLDCDAAIELIERIAALPGCGAEEGALLTTLQREQLRAAERFPLALESSERGFYLHLDRIVPIPGAGIFLNGWFAAKAGAVAAVVCHAGLQRRRIDDGWVRHPRADVAAHLANLGVAVGEKDYGFACFVPLRVEDVAHVIAVTCADGSVHRMRVPAASNGIAPLQAVRAVLSSFTVDHRALRQLLDRHVGPAVQAGWASRAAVRRVPVIQRFGVQPETPLISVIVPLYGRHDFAEYQLALFADDADFQGAELIYFVDDPAIYDEFRLACADLYSLFRVPFSLVFAGANLGFAGANNCAVDAARGSYLVLMNSDVFPKRNGWLAELLKAYRSQTAPGLLGVKLLYEDGSVQHAGMTFRRYAPWGDLWINHHPNKGQSPAGLDGVREFDAVTAACVMIDASLYRELGGLSEDYIVGDFEDSDLCLRALQAGRRNRVALDIELYHLERQSQDRIGDLQWRTNLTVFNCWQHDRRWSGLIEGRIS